MSDGQQGPHAGGTSGAESRPESTDQTADEPVGPGPGDVEIPLGVPVPVEEYERLKDRARRASPEEELDRPQEDRENSDEN
jgi:hypothetical protein